MPCSDIGVNCLLPLTSGSSCWRCRHQDNHCRWPPGLVNHLDFFPFSSHLKKITGQAQRIVDVMKSLESSAASIRASSEEEEQVIAAVLAGHIPGKTEKVQDVKEIISWAREAPSRIRPATEAAGEASAAGRHSETGGRPVQSEAGPSGVSRDSRGDGERPDRRSRRARAPLQENRSRGRGKGKGKANA